MVITPWPYSCVDITANIPEGTERWVCGDYGLHISRLAPEMCSEQCDD